MNIGIPTESMTGEGRIALIPDACKAISSAGNKIFVQHGAGVESGYSDEAFSDAGAVIVDSAEQLFESAQLIVKVKQPLQQELRYLRREHILFSYLHLAADHGLINALCDIGLCAIPFESITDAEGGLPLLMPMSKVAGRIAAIRGASLLFRNRGGRGVLLGGIDGAESGRVVILGAGIAGSQALAVAVALGAQVDVVDLDEDKLLALRQAYPDIKTHIFTPQLVESVCLQADLVIGAVLLAGRRAPVVLKRSVIKRMKSGSVIVDIAIDQGGCVEGIRQTNSVELCYVEDGVIHSAVPNMPAAVARTASQSLSSVVLPYVLQLSESSQLFDTIFDVMGENIDIVFTQAGEAPVLDQPELGQLELKQSGLEQMYNAIAICRGEVVDAVLRQELDDRS
jgi:alanine dehydrogenase